MLFALGTFFLSSPSDSTEFLVNGTRCFCCLTRGTHSYPQHAQLKHIKPHLFHLLSGQISGSLLRNRSKQLRLKEHISGHFVFTGLQQQRLLNPFWMVPEIPIPGKQVRYHKEEAMGLSLIPQQSQSGQLDAIHQHFCVHSMFQKQQQKPKLQEISSNSYILFSWRCQEPQKHLSRTSHAVPTPRVQIQSLRNGSQQENTPAHRWLEAVSTGESNPGVQ